MTQAAHFIDKLAWIAIRDKTMLVVRSRDRELFYLPGGKREPGESDLETLAREVREELGGEIVTETARYLATFEAPADGGAPLRMVRLTCYTAECIGDLRASAEIEELRWIGAADRALLSVAGVQVLDWLVASSVL